MTRTPRSAGLLALATAALLTLTACGGGSDPTSTADGDSTATGAETTAAGSDESVVVGSANFSESIVLAHVYAGALKNAGVNASTNTGIGSREIYLKALEDGSIDVIPEYTGALGFFYDPEFSETEPDAVFEAIQGLVPEEFTVLERSEAEDNDSVVVTQETAEEYTLSSIADLADVAGELSFGAPPEFETRPQGLSGLQETYGVEFSSFRPLTGQALVQALQNGQVDAANIFSTDPAIAVNDLVVLEDTEKLFGSQNMVPLVRTEVADLVRDSLNAVSAALTTEKVTEMLRQTDVEQRNPEEVAAEFLEEAGL
ncbi:MAG: ABC transporter substrate-binding protein [Intrasporangiaceae bacterium]|nr:ABC transporter substrate-binding protein [Intrasporangiaceae bacterium]